MIAPKGERLEMGARFRWLPGDPWNWRTADSSAPLRNDKQKRLAKATADPPFDFAQGRLFGDDNKKGKNNGTTNDMRRAI